jgi:hypothetical protein
MLQVLQAQWRPLEWEVTEVAIISRQVGTCSVCGDKQAPGAVTHLTCRCVPGCRLLSFWLAAAFSVQHVPAVVLFLLLLFLLLLVLLLLLLLLLLPKGLPGSFHCTLDHTPWLLLSHSSRAGANAGGCAVCGHRCCRQPVAAGVQGGSHTQVCTSSRPCSSLQGRVGDAVDRGVMPYGGSG